MRKVLLEARFEDLIRAAAGSAECSAMAFLAIVTKSELPWKVTVTFDAHARGHIERDWRIEDEPDRLLLAAVKLAEILYNDDTEEFDEASWNLNRAID